MTSRTVVGYTWWNNLNKQLSTGLCYVPRNDEDDPLLFWKKRTVSKSGRDCQVLSNAQCFISSGLLLNGTRRMAIANWTCVSWVPYAPGTIAVNVTWIKREFNACQTPRSMYPSIFNHFWNKQWRIQGAGWVAPIDLRELFTPPQWGWYTPHSRWHTPQTVIPPLGVHWGCTV